MKSEKYTREVLETAVRQSRSMSEVMRWLGLVPAGGTHSHITRRVKAFGIDTSHFLGRAANQGAHHRGGTKVVPWQEVLVLRTSGNRRKAHVLRRALLESGRQYHCGAERCPLSNDWLGKPLVLHVNHKNGNWLDDRAENLEFLCPNCHSQTETYCRGRACAELTSRALYAREFRTRKRGPVAESVDARGLGPRARKGVRVRIPPGPLPNEEASDAVPGPAPGTQPRIRSQRALW
jgi:hypothetical protein